MVAAAREVGIMPGTSTYLSAIWPISMFSCCAKKDRPVEIQFKKVSTKAGAGILPQRVSGYADRTIQVQDAMVMKLLNLILKSTGKKGVPQGGVVSPLLSNLYLNEVDRMLERAIATTRRGKYTHVQYARFADDMVILIDSHPRNDWLMRAVDKRLREELARLRVEVNEDKSRTIDLRKGESFGFLGFEYRLVLGRNQKWRPQFVPKMKKRTALFAKLREVFRQHVSQPVGEVIEEINPILRGWMNYFRIGHSSRCFSKIRDWVEMKIRRHLMRSRLRKGQGWKRWSSEWIYRRLGLYNDYRLRRPALAKAAPVPEGV
jgi:RNA-directed DNA polymerase